MTGTASDDDRTQRTTNTEDSTMEHTSTAASGASGTSGPGEAREARTVLQDTVPGGEVPAYGSGAPTEAIPVPGSSWADPTPSTSLPEPAAPVLRPSGPHVPAVVLGLVCLVIAGLTIASQTAGYVFAWSVVGPGLIVTAGAIFLLAGLVGLVRRR